MIASAFVVDYIINILVKYYKCYRWTCDINYVNNGILNSALAFKLISIQAENKFQNVQQSLLEDSRNRKLYGSYATIG